MNQNDALFSYILRLADSSLILSQRLSEWTSKGPFLEEDLALTNIALDIMGQANSLLDYAAKVEGKGRNADQLAFFRGEREYFNHLLAEQPNGDYAKTMVRQAMVDHFDYLVYSRLTKSTDPTVAGIAEKSIKEITYHVRHSSSWVDRFGNGTEESHARAQAALSELWRFSEDMFETSEGDKKLAKEGIAVEAYSLREEWHKNMKDLFAKANLNIPEGAFMQHGSRNGVHTEHLGYILAEMQHLPRMHPNAKW